MHKTIFITGATDGIGLETARQLVAQGHHVLLHGRDPAKLDKVETTLRTSQDGGKLEGYLADLSRMHEVEALAVAVSERHPHLDVLINNAGVFKTSSPITPEGLDARFAVNTIAPWLLTQRLLPLMDASGRVINLSSAAQARVDPEALAGRVRVADDLDAYAQSKLALTMWSFALAHSLGAEGPAIIALNPGSLLGTKMVKEGFGMPGKDIGIGADILIRAALTDEFAMASGRYFDNDSGRFAPPHADALDAQHRERIEHAVEAIVAALRP